MSKAKEKNIWRRILYIDRRVIYVLTLLLFIPLLYPLKIPFNTTAVARTFLNAINEYCPDGSYVLLCNGGLLEFTPINSAGIALINTLLAKNVKLVCASFSEAGPLGFSFAFSRWIDKGILATKTYGVDYVILPFTGPSASDIPWAAVARDIRASTGGVDFYDFRLDDLAIMEGINGAADFQFLAQIGSHETNNIQAVVKNIQTPYHLSLVVVSGGIAHVSNVNFFATGQIKGYIEEADYASWELISGYAGVNLKQVDVYSLVHIAVPALIVVGNILLFLSKREREVSVEVKK